MTTQALARRALGHVAFAVVMIAVGAMGAIQGAFATPWLGVPRELPARIVLVYACAVVSLAGGVALLSRRTAVIGARVLLVSFVLWFLFFRVALLFRTPGTGAWWASGYTAAMIASSWILYAWFASDWDRERVAFAVGPKALRAAQALFGLALIPFGIAHFTYLQRTVDMVPGWLPWHTALGVGTGIAFIAAGLAMITGVYARLAAALITLQMGLFGLLVWVPVMLKGNPSLTDTTEFVTTFVLTAAAWVVADSYAATGPKDLSRRE